MPSLVTFLPVVSEKKPFEEIVDDDYEKLISPGAGPFLVR